MEYWHKIQQWEVDGLIYMGVSNQFVMDNFSQPDWCTYPEAINGMMGCWSLTDNTENGSRTKISNEFCKGCDCCKTS